MALAGKILRPLASPLVLDNVLTIDQDRDVSDAISDARYAISGHPEQQVGSAYLVEQTPTLAGVVQDETPARKDRTRLSCRATDFAVNQYFNGAVDIAGWTEFSISCWIRHGAVANNMYAMGSYGPTTANRAFIFGVLTNGDTPYLSLSSDAGGSGGGVITFPANSTNDNEWHLLTATYDFATETMTGYIDGRDVTAASTVTAGTNGSINTSQDPDDFTVGTLIQNPTSFDWNGQIQQPLIYEGVWSAAEVRDLYLGKYDAITAPTYGWFLDSDTAHPLTSASPTLAPANSPDLYEDDAVPVDWLNEKGWNGAAEFNNVDTEITFPSDISLTGDFEISVDLLGAGVNNFIGDDVSGLNLAYSNSLAITLRINNNNQTFNFSSGFISTAFSSVVITRTSGVTTVTKDGETAPETLVESGTFMISRLGRERNNWFEGQIKNFKIVDAGTTILDWPLVENSLDVSGNGNNGTDSANITYAVNPKRWDEELDSTGAAADNSESFGVARRDGQLRGSKNAISLDGINQYGTLPTAVSNYLDIGNAYTVSLQFEPSDTSTVQILVSNGITASNRFSMQVHDDGTVRTAAYDGIFYPKSGGSVSVGVASQLVCSWDGSSVFRAWLDGLELGGASGPTTDQSGGLAIGRRPSTAQNLLNGKVWDFRVYDSAITSLDDLDSLSAVTEIPMSETTGDISYDVSGNGKDCTWVNSPTWGNQSQYFWNENQGCDVVGTFDGVDDYIQGAAVAMSSEMTLTFWGKYDFSIGSAPWSLICNRVDADNGISISSNGEGNNFFTFRLAGTNYSTNLSLSGLFGDWAHYSIILSAGTVTVYRNNAAVTPQSSAASGIPADVGFFIGKRNTNYSPSGTQIHSARVYSKALTADERTHVYTDGASGTDPTLTDCLLKYDIDEGSGLTVADSSGNGNDGTINGATSDEFWGTIIPAASDGTSLIRATPSNPAGPWLYEGLGSTYVNFDVVPNANQWLEQRWIAAEFDGVSSSTYLSDSFDWNQSFDISLNYRLADHSLAEYLFCNSNTLVYSLRTSEGRPQFRNGGTTFTYSQAGSLTDFNDLRVTYTGGQTGDIEITLNGVTETFTNDAGSPPASNQIRFGSDGAVSAFTEGEIRTLAVTNGASDYYDSPLLGCSLDLSSQVNHGTDTDVVYNRLTDLSYTAGATVEQPFSVNDDTAGRVSELIQFTFPKV